MRIKKAHRRTKHETSEGYESLAWHQKEKAKIQEYIARNNWRRIDTVKDNMCHSSAEEKRRIMTETRIRLRVDTSNQDIVLLRHIPLRGTMAVASPALARTEGVHTRAGLATTDMNDHLVLDPKPVCCEPGFFLVRRRRRRR